MSITDELRKWAYEHLYKSGIRSDLLTIADRIDAEHEKECAEAWDIGYESDFLGIEQWLTEHPQAMEHHGWVRLPKDADGVPIRMGDVVERIDPPHNPSKVTVMTMFDDGDWQIHMDERPNVHATYQPSLLRHHYKPTVEGVLREMLDKAHVWDGLEAAMLPDLIAEYAAKLRLVSEDA